MPRHARFIPVETSEGWRINVPAAYSESGKRERHFFQTKDKAKAHAAELRKKVKAHGAGAALIRPSLAEAAVAAEEILKPWDVSLVEAAKIVAAIRERESASKPLDEAVDSWLVACDHLRERTLAGYRQIANRLKSGLGNTNLAAVTPADLEEVIISARSSGTSNQGRYRSARAFWRWAARKGWCDAELINGVELPRISSDQGEISILTPKQTRHLLQVAEEHFPEAVASYALQLFAGIRAEELTRLEERNVTEEGIEMSADVTKKGRRRHINPHPTLSAWLKLYPFRPCSNWREVNKACRRLAGWQLEARMLKWREIEAQEPTLGRWPQNALRHSHASYALAAGTSLETLLFEFGHTGSPALLRQHYVGRASKKQAIEYFSIGPKGNRLHVLSVA